MAGNITVTFLGCGDAFASGGRFHPCVMVEAPESRLLIDCGASAPVAMKRHGVDTANIDAVILSHLHGDHFGGIPFLLLDAEHLSGRSASLTVAGPPDVAERVATATEAFYPGLLADGLGFAIEYVELRAEQRENITGAIVTPGTALHGGGAPAFSLRVECAGKTIAYSGDTGWTENLLRVAAGADLFICESSFYNGEREGHLTYRTLVQRRADFDCKRLILTHMGDDVLARQTSLEIEAATDGLQITL
jgi:ribonuclease BN (tRNA processing enzyme)